MLHILYMYIYKIVKQCFSMFSKYRMYGHISIETLQHYYITKSLANKLIKITVVFDFYYICHRECKKSSLLFLKL